MELKDRVYILKGKATPLSFTLQSRHTHKNPLLYFDGTVNRELRYARNQRSIFADEQDQHALLTPIVFENGVLKVAKTDTILNEFLQKHPKFGKTFVELNHEADAEKDLQRLDAEVDALIAAKGLSIDMAEMVVRVGLGANTQRMSSAEIRRDVLMFARQSPLQFLEMIDDPDLKLEDDAGQFIDAGLISIRKNGDIFFNTEGNKKKIASTPYGEDPVDVFSAWLITDEGQEAYKMLKDLL
jgi:hypothetical protein